MKIATVLLIVCVLYCRADDPCSKPTDAELKCMEAAGRKNGADVLAHCSGVDFDALGQGDIQGSKICQFPDCITALGKDVYTPCNRSDLTMCVKKACTIPGSNCSAVTEVQLQCMIDAAGKSQDDMDKFCSEVDLDLLQQMKVKESKLCDHPDCMKALEKDLYAPCNRSDLDGCIQQICKSSSLKTAPQCSNVTSEELQCMMQAGSKNGEDIEMHCKGVDLNALAKQQIDASHICNNTECIDALEKDVYTPCKRSDLGMCLKEVCKHPPSSHCSNITSEEIQCMTQAGTKNVNDITMHCKGVDLNALAKQQISESHICSNMECIDELEKDVYTPCKRSDVGMCLKEFCNSSCSKVSESELKCMTDAGTANGEKLMKPCAGVDFDRLKNSDVKGSKICEHPDCVKALGMYVYTPCKREDLTSCIRSEC